MKFLPVLALLATLTLVPTPGRAEEAPRFFRSPVVIDRQSRTTPLQMGADGTLYQVRYNFAKGREYWSSPYQRHPSYGIRFVYLLDPQGQRLSQNLYVELASGRLQLASNYRNSPGEIQVRASR
jgi:hypothetical protein